MSRLRSVRYCVVVPTIRQKRPEFAAVLSALTASFTTVTDLHVLDGSAGKAQTLNAAYRYILAGTDADFYVTLDDDLIMKPGWQDVMECAFAASAGWGALGLYLGDGQRPYMGLDDARQVEQVHGMPCFRSTHVVLIPDSPQKYQFWEDGWRGQQVREAGYESAYLVSPECTPEVVVYGGTEEEQYLQAKIADVEASRPHVEAYLQTPGRRS
jgi:hypothetical protein